MSEQVPFIANVVPPSPEAAALAKYADIPVSLYTGIPEIAIPLYELKEHDLHVPISLSYHASAHKVEDQASRVGLGWSVNAGGMVTRSIRGLPDEYPGGFLQQAAEIREVGAYFLGSDEDRYRWYDAMARGCRSAEPDIYYFNFAGYSGKFQFDWDGTICIASDAKLQITPAYGLDPFGVKFIERWEIVTPDGIRRTFDVREHNATRPVGGFHPDPCRNILETNKPPQTWYLGEIASPFTNSYVRFEYGGYFQTYERWSLETMVHNEFFAPTFPEREKLICKVDGKHPQKISTSSDDTTVEFIPGPNRTDVTGDARVLGEIRVKSRHENVAKRWKFEYDNSIGRLTLKSLQEYGNGDGKPPFIFSYYGGGGGLHALSFQQDHWGFPNENQEQTLVPRTVVVRPFGGKVILPGADRSAAPRLLTGGMLRQITYPTGGTDKFDFEPHDYSFEQDQPIKAVPVTIAKQIGGGAPAFDTPPNQRHVERRPFSLSDRLELTLGVQFTYGARFGGGILRPTVEIETSTGEQVFHLVGAGAAGQDGEPTEEFVRVVFNADPNSDATDGDGVLTEDLPAGSYVLVVSCKMPVNPDNGRHRIDVTLSWREPTGEFTRKVQGGGVRIAKITRSYGFGNPDRITTYHYSMLEGGTTLISSGSLLESYYVYEKAMTYWRTESFPPKVEKYVRFAQNRSALGTTRGSHVGYRQVTVVEGVAGGTDQLTGTNGKSVYTFRSPIDIPDWVELDIPFPPPTSYDHARGLLIEQSDYRAGSELPVRRIVNTYNIEERTIPALKVGWLEPGDGPTGAGFISRYAVAGYSNVIGYARLIKREEHLNESPNTFVTQASFEFEEDGHKQLSRETTTSSEGVFIREYRYPSNYPPGTSAGIDELVKQQVANALVESVHYRKDGLLISATRNRYGLFEGRVHQTHSETAATDVGLVAQGSVFEAVAGLYEPRWIYHAYDSRGNLLEFSQPAGMVTCLIWDSAGTQLTAKIANARRGQVFYEGFEDNLGETTTAQAYTGLRSKFISGSYTMPAADLPRLAGNYVFSYWKKVGAAPWARVERIIANYLPGTAISTDPIDGFLDEVRLHPLDAVMTTFAYQPLIGLQTLTDVNSLPTYFEYDSFGRLSTVLDHKRDIRTRYEYEFGRSIGDGGPAPLSHPNHVRTYKTLASGFKAVEQLVRADHLNVERSTVFSDGMARAIQTVQRRGSPTTNDVVRIAAYDEFGREVTSFLPFTTNATDGEYKAFDPTNHPLFEFYSSEGDNVANTTAPFARTRFDGSPLNRVIEKGAPGEAWQPTANRPHTHRFEYRANVEADNVLHWRLVSGGVQAEAVCRAGTLRVEFSVDEHDGRLGTFYNDLGQKILQLVETPTGEQARTYFVYDDKRNLAVIIPPRPVAQLTPDAPSAQSPKRIGAEELKLECYRYSYDRRNRMVEKGLPGSESMFLIYDRWDRLALTQDGNDRSAGVWEFHKYDARDCLIMSGKVAADGTRDKIAHALDEFYMSSPEEHRFEVAGTSHGYSNRSFPLLDETAKIDRIIYFDDYSFISTLISPESYGFQSELGVTEALERAVGRETGSKLRVFPTKHLVSSATYYDTDYRPIQVLSEDHMQGHNRLTNQYDFTGSILASLYTHKQPGTSIQVEKQYAYDHAQRPKSVRLRIDDGDPVFLSALEYNALGQLVRKKLHSNDGGTSFAQEIDYRYNIRGWLASINRSVLEHPAAAPKLFAMDLTYENELASPRNIPQFNGNVSAVRWRNAQVDEDQAYVYEYDGFDRLTAARYRVNGPKDGAFDEFRTAYDPNGNLQEVSRYAFTSSGRVAIDSLVYRYAGNQLRSVRDSSGRSEGFHDAGVAGEAYEYDLNGNMTADRNKSIQISYNPLNLIDKIVKDSGESVRFGFDAAGRKRFRELLGPGAVSVGRLDYVGDCIFEDGVLRLVMHNEGRVVRDSEDGLWRFQYFLNDHLGNIRVAFEVRTDGPRGGAPPINTVVYGADYYPSGVRIDAGHSEDARGPAIKQLFGGKELQDVMGLDWYDFGARMLDPAVGRWWVLDPEAEKHPGVTPYGYALNNPIRYVDPDGRDVEEVFSALESVVSEVGSAVEFAYSLIPYYFLAQSTLSAQSAGPPNEPGLESGYSFLEYVIPGLGTANMIYDALEHPDAPVDINSIGPPLPGLGSPGSGGRGRHSAEGAPSKPTKVFGADEQGNVVILKGKQSAAMKAEREKYITRAEREKYFTKLQKKRVKSEPKKELNRQQTKGGLDELQEKEASIRAAHKENILGKINQRIKEELKKPELKKPK